MPVNFIFIKQTRLVEKLRFYDYAYKTMGKLELKQVLIYFNNTCIQNINIVLQLT